MDLPINKILEGDALTHLKQLPSESIDCIMTSPPYWNLRDYGVEGQLGLEPTFEEYISKLCNIFDEVKRVLKKSGTCWVNLGDSYNNSSWAGDKPNKFDHDPKDKKGGLAGRGGQLGYPDKCLSLIPFRFAIGMVNRGWILRNDIVWFKRNSMPSSVTDRLANKWEHIFLFVKNKKYFFDLDAVRKPYETPSFNRIKAGFGRSSSFNYRLREACKGTLQAKFGDIYTASPKEIENYGSPRAREYRWKNKDFLNSTSLKGYSNANKFYLEKEEKRQEGRKDKEFYNPLGGNPGDHWDITTKGHLFAHFAVYPEEICEMPIKSGCPKGGIVLDPFFGSGTTGLVALKLNRNFIGIEMNSDYINIAKERLKPWLEQRKLK